MTWSRRLAVLLHADLAGFALGVERVSLETLAERSDYVSVHTLLNAETRHLIGEAFFKRMKPTAILINTSRGPVVDEKALAKALRDKRLAGAALDVWEEEPVNSDNPLLQMENVIATPHPLLTSPTTFSFGQRASVKNTSLNSESPVIILIGRTSMPG